MAAPVTSPAAESLDGVLSDLEYEVNAAEPVDGIRDDSLVWEMVEQLKSPDYRKRHNARAELTRVGEPALSSLEAALEEEDERTRWEAARTISGIDCDRSAQLLATCLSDESSGIRSIAADGLTSMGRKAAAPTLEMLKANGDKVVARVGAHHVLWRLSHRADMRRELDPVLDALSDGAAATAAPAAAARAMDSISSKSRAAIA